MSGASCAAVETEAQATEGELILLSYCDECGKPFLKKRKGHKYCDDVCRYKVKNKQADPERNKQRAKLWYQENKEHHKNKVRASRALRLAALRSPKRDRLTIDAWKLPAPELDYLPGGGFTLDLRPRHKFEHWQISGLHGIVTVITGRHCPNMPVFSLVPWQCGCGWGAYVNDVELARSIAGKAHCVRFDSGPAALHCGPLMRIKAPRVETGLHKLRIDAITPVHIRCDNSTVIRKVPTSRHLRGTLEGFLPRRLGLVIPPGSVAINLLEDHTRPEPIRLAGNGRKLGDASGWVGHVIIETNAVGRFLLECAALGLGYGGKVAFGFGRIRVTNA